MLSLAATEVEWKVARIIKLDHSKGPQVVRLPVTCESCEYSSSDSDSEVDTEDEMSSSLDSLADLEIPIRVGGCQKWINGLTKRTTCDDVIYALLSHEKNANENLDLQMYMMYERWREVERPLKGRTKILKVWRAWGSECRNMRFFIKKVENPYDSGSEIMRTRRTKRHQSQGHSGYVSTSHTKRDHTSKRHSKEVGHHSHRHEHRDRERSRRRALDHDNTERKRQKHASKSLDRKLAHDQFTGYDADAIPSCAKYPSPDEQPQAGGITEDNTKSRFFHQLVQLIIDQEKRIQDQVSRLGETDVQIEKYETKMHMVRVEKNGRDYVQDAYLREKSDESGSCASADEARSTHVALASRAKDTDVCADICENILRLQDRIAQEEGKIEDLSSQIFDESQRDFDNFSLASGYDGSPGRLLPGPSRGLPGLNPPSGYNTDLTANGEISEEIHKLRHEIERSISLSIAQQKQMHLVDETLRECEVQFKRKELYANQLLVESHESEHSDEAERRPRTSLSKLKSKSCEAIADQRLSFPEMSDNMVSGNNYQVTGRDARPHYNSDSGVESVDNKPDSDACNLETRVKRGNPELSPNSDHGYIEDDHLMTRRVNGKSMVPYFTYATYDREHSESQSLNRKASNSDDSNSDTGLSSLHSDDQSPVLETLV